MPLRYAFKSGIPDPLDAGSTQTTSPVATPTKAIASVTSTAHAANMLCWSISFSIVPKRISSSVSTPIAMKKPQTPVTAPMAR